jgi:phosphohistidine swiveling domain-containing protein
MNDIKSKLEKHFKDAVDIEFTIQDGKLWILNARPAKRTSVANLKITNDLFFEKVIDENEAISRLRLRDIDEVLMPTISNEKDLKIIGKGLPASSGASTGRIYFSSEDLILQKGTSCILCRVEVSPEDLNAIFISKGIITSRGGMTSHAAVSARGMGKPCISSIGGLIINTRENQTEINGYTLNKGDWITINGSNGNLYLGKGNVFVPNWRSNKYLYAFSRIIEKAICTNILDNNLIGKAWIIRDYFFHNIPIGIGETHKKSVNNDKYVSFVQPNKNEVASIYRNIRKLNREDENIKLIIQGIRNSLLRQLPNKVGIGNHYKYYRPLLDPMSFVNRESTANDIKTQLIGEEFFNISKYIPNLIDIFKIKIYFEIETDSENGLSFLDFTNPKGESLVIKDNNIVSAYIEINEQKIKTDELPSLYNTFRKREYFWTWYSENLTTHKEMVDFINKSKVNRVKNFRLNTYAHELELLENDSYTKSGDALKN